MNFLLNNAIELLLALYLLSIFLELYLQYFKVTKVTEDNLVEKYVTFLRRNK